MSCRHSKQTIRLQPTPLTSIVDDPCINRGVDTKIGRFCPQIQRTLFDKFSNLPFLFSVKNTGCVIEPQFLANVGTFCVNAVLGHNVSTINLNDPHSYTSHHRKQLIGGKLTNFRQLLVKTCKLPTQKTDHSTHAPTQVTTERS